MNATENTSWFKALAAACAATLMASGVYGEVTWQLTDTSATLGGSGTYTLSTEPTLSSLTLLSGSDVLLQGEGISFQSPARVLLDKTVSCQLALPLSVSGELAFLHTATETCSSCNETCLPADSSNPIVVLSNVSLEDWEIAGGQGCGECLSGYGYAKHIERGDGWCTAQIQVPVDYLKCVKVRLEQRGNDVVGYVVYAKYVTLTSQDVDFDTQGMPFTIATTETAYGYGVKRLDFVSLCRSQDNVVTLTEKVSWPDAQAKLAVDYGTTLRCDGNEIVTQDGIFPPALDLNGVLAITNTTSVTFTNEIAGTNGTLYLGGQYVEIHQATNEVRYVAPMPTVWTTVATNAFLAALTNVYINAFSGMAIPATPSQNIQHLRGTNGFMVGQCQQVDGSWRKCVYIEFVQNGTNILARITKAYYSSAPFGTDFDTLAETTSSNPDATHKKSYTVGSTPTSYNYGVGDFTMFFDATFTGELNCSKATRIQYTHEIKAVGMTIEQYGGIAEVTHKKGLPISGTYRVMDGELVLAASGCEIAHGVSDGGTKIYVENGGTLTQRTGCVFDKARQILSLDASTLQLKVCNGDHDANCYINNLTLSNGCVVQGAWPRVCYSANATWYVKGTEASVFKETIAMASTGRNNFTVVVEDVTQDEAVDFTIKGGIVDFDAGQHCHCTFVKQGAGTLVIQGQSYWRMPARVEEGVLRFDSSNAFQQHANETNGFILAGGTLAFAAGTANGVGPIALTKASALVLGEGASVSFADSTAQTWADGATLTITGPEVRNHTRTGVRIGSAQTLTGKRRAALRYNGVRVRQDAEGYLQPDKTPFVLILR